MMPEYGNEDIIAALTSARDKALAEVHRLSQRLSEATRADSDDLWLIASDEWVRSRRELEQKNLELLAERDEARAELEKARALNQTCTCQSWPPDGPAPDCPIHGAIRALNEALQTLTQVRVEVGRLRDDITGTEAKLGAAQEIIALFGLTSASSRSKEEEALTQAWQDFANIYGYPPKPSRERITELSKRRQEIRAATLAGLRGDEQWC